MLRTIFSPKHAPSWREVVLHALGLLFRDETWESVGGRPVSEQMDRQVRPDGSHFEQSTYYHLYALDMFLFHAIVSKPSARLRALTRKAEYLDALAGVGQSLPLLGDDDGGLFFHPYGPRAGFATGASCGVLLNRPGWVRGKENLYEQGVWWLGPRVFEGLDALPELRWEPPFVSKRRNSCDDVRRLFLHHGRRTFRSVSLRSQPLGHAECRGPFQGK